MIGARTPRWTRHDVSDPGITLLGLLAFLGDALSDYQDAVARERRARTRRVLVSLIAVLVAGAWVLKRAGP
jgi:hypothetical protein